MIKPYSRSWYAWEAYHRIRHEHALLEQMHRAAELHLEWFEAGVWPPGLSMSTDSPPVYSIFGRQRRRA